MEENQKTIPEIIEEVKIEICDKYCRYPYEYNGDDLIDKFCTDCPLGRLG